MIHILIDWYEFKMINWGKSHSVILSMVIDCGCYLAIAILVYSKDIIALMFCYYTSILNSVLFFFFLINRSSKFEAANLRSPLPQKPIGSAHFVFIFFFIGSVPLTSMCSPSPLTNLHISRNRLKRSRSYEQELSISLYDVAVEYCSVRVNIMLNLSLFLHNLFTNVCKLPLLVVNNNRVCTEQHLSLAASEVWKHFKCTNFLLLLAPPQTFVRDDPRTLSGSSSATPAAAWCLKCSG